VTTVRKSLGDLLKQSSRVIAGIMSGTSLDGVDCAIVRLTGTGRDVEMSVLSFVSQPYSDDLRALILRTADQATSSVREISQLNFRLAHAYRDAAVAACREARLAPSALDAVGSHGQTIHHIPHAEDCAGLSVTSTLQVGDPSVLANLLGVVTVGDFRVADMALGGQGAPLVPYLDYVRFSTPSTNRILLNIGGIANLTVLPSSCALADVLAFDTGPGNLLIDGAAQALFEMRYDDGGRIASTGKVCETLLAELLKDPFYVAPPPKSTGREVYSLDMVGRVVATAREAGCNDADVVTTVTELTARTIVAAIDRFVRAPYRPRQLLAAGGGVHNEYLMSRLGLLLSDIQVATVQSEGLDPDAKEAVCFALLAHETLNGRPTNLPSVTGATRGTVLGKICVPL